MSDPASVKAASAAVAAASGGAAWLAAAKDLALELFGIPLAAVLLGAVGAFGTRSFIASEGLRTTLSAGLFWTVVGCGSAPLIGWALDVPDKFLGGIALAAASGLQLAWPVVMKEGPGWLRRKLEQLTGGGRTGGGNGPA